MPDQFTTQYVIWLGLGLAGLGALAALVLGPIGPFLWVAFVFVLGFVGPVIVVALFRGPYPDSSRGEATDATGGAADAEPGGTCATCGAAVPAGAELCEDCSRVESWRK